MNQNTTYIETYKIWDIYFSETLGKYLAYDSLEGSRCVSSDEFDFELKRKLDAILIED